MMMMERMTVMMTTMTVMMMAMMKMMTMALMRTMVVAVMLQRKYPRVSATERPRSGRRDPGTRSG